MSEPYAWKSIYQQAVDENDVSKILPRIVEADHALDERYREIIRLAYRPETDAELRAMLSAADTLLDLKTEKLGWPKVFATQPKRREKGEPQQLNLTPPD
jgi:hypothetical protein